MRRSQRIVVPCPLSKVGVSVPDRQDDTLKLSPAAAAAAPPSFNNDAAVNHATIAGYELAKSSRALHATIAVCVRCMRDGNNNTRVGWLSV